jgi:hypothetical protein
VLWFMVILPLWCFLWRFCICIFYPWYNEFIDILFGEFVVLNETANSEISKINAIHRINIPENYACTLRLLIGHIVLYLSFNMFIKLSNLSDPRAHSLSCRSILSTRWRWSFLKQLSKLIRVSCGFLTSAWSTS